MTDQSDAEAPSSAYVPASTYRASRLPESIRDRIDREATRLADAWSASTESDEFNYTSREEEILDRLTRRYARWWTRGSERTVVCLGETVAGQPIFPRTHTGVVIKFTPTVRNSDRTFQSPGPCGNLAELQIWRHVVDHGYDAHFGTILDYADDGAWIAMQRYLPYFPADSTTDIPEYLSGRHTDRRYGTVLQTALDRDGTDIGVHTKNGNVGIKQESNGAYTPVSIDYGAHTSVPELAWTSSK